MRILRPGGIFIIREHDLELNESEGKVPYSMLDLAHSVFNAVTGVSVQDEIEEVRAFRSILEWREILENMGFIDSLVYEVEDGDPTWDEMMCFLKPNIETARNVEERVHVPSPRSESRTFLKEGADPPVIQMIGTLLSQAPEIAVSNATTILHFLADFLPKVQNKLSVLILIAIPYLIKENDIFGSESRTVAKQIVDLFSQPVQVKF